jgi:hypothetical protein
VIAERAIEINTTQSNNVDQAISIRSTSTGTNDQTDLQPAASTSGFENKILPWKGEGFCQGELAFDVLP